MMSSGNRKILLAKPGDWDAWISFVRTRATNSRVWDLVNPDLTTKPISIVEPIEPEFEIPDDSVLFDRLGYEAFKARKDAYKTKYAKYERQQKALSDLITFIQETITSHNIVYIQKEEAHPWNILRALKKRLAPSDEARSLDIEQRYHKLCKGPGNQNVETWLDEWMATITEAKEHSVAEVNGTRPVRDFLMAIRPKEPTFADAHLVFLRYKVVDDLYELAEAFRQHLRLQQLHNLTKESTHSAFTANSNTPNPKTNSTLSYQGQQIQPKPCVCGDTH